jgi:hypothetical protein
MQHYALWLNVNLFLADIFTQTLEALNISPILVSLPAHRILVDSSI